jgi:hypothetical protein
MTRRTWRPVLALGAVLAVCGAAGADDRNTALPAGTTAGSTTMTLGGQGTAADAALADTELTHGYRGYHGGYGYRGYGYGGGYGYRGYYGGGYGYRGYYGGGYGYAHRGYYGGGYGYARGYYGGGYGGYYRGYSIGVYRPAYYSSYYYASSPVYYGGYYCDPGVSYSYGIGGGAATGAPALQLGAADPVQPMGQPALPGGTFRYDGGPANPVPQPMPDAQPIPPADPSAAPSNLPIAGKKPVAAPYKYKAYGEK